MRMWILAAAVVTLSALTATAQSSQAPKDEHPTLPAGAGRDVMIRVCSQCHSPEVVADQQNDAAGWKSIVDQMASKGAAATDAEFDEIIRYLATAFPPPK